MEEEFSKQLLRSQIEVQEATFADLGKELHDNIGQLLNSTRMFLGTAQRGVENAPQMLGMAEESLIKAISEVRSISKSLDREWLQQFNFIENLATEVNRINAAKVFAINFSHPGKISLQPDEQIILFRIVQEALQNAIKHSGAGNIDISITELNSALTVKVNDNGKGFDTLSPSKGLGLKNMKHRTELLGGKLDCVSRPSGGCTITLQLPLKNNA